METIGPGKVPRPAWLDRWEQEARDSGLVLTNNWDGRSSLFQSRSSYGDFRVWVNDTFLDTQSSCAVFTVVALPASDHAWMHPVAEPIPWPAAKLQPPHSKIRGLAIFGPNSMGPPNSVHGGAIATAFDAFMGQTNMLNGTFGPTANLTVHYRAGVGMKGGGAVVSLEALVERVEGKKAFLAAVMKDGSSGKILATATGLWVYSPERAASINKAIQFGPPPPEQNPFLLASREPRKVPVVSDESASATTPRTALSRTLMRQGWELDNSRTAALSGNYITHSPRLQYDSLWLPAEKRFRIAFAFSRQVMGPPMTVHGGCVFAALDTAVTVFLFSRGASDLGTKGGVMVTASMTVDYIKPVVLDAEYVVETRIENVETQKGRARYTVFASLFPVLNHADLGDRPLATGRAIFVELDTPWAGQPRAGSKL